MRRFLNSFAGMNQSYTVSNFQTGRGLGEVNNRPRRAFSLWKETPYANGHASNDRPSSITMMAARLRGIARRRPRARDERGVEDGSTVRQRWTQWHGGDVRDTTPG